SPAASPAEPSASYLVMRARLRRGSRVFARREGSVPWASVRGEGVVSVRTEGEWAQIVAMPGTRMLAGEAWIRADAFLEYWYATSGAEFDRVEGEDARFLYFRVRSVEPSARLARRGLRVGDVPIRRDSVLHLNPVLDRLFIDRDGRRINLP
ncbi:MAG: hypothetical protein AAF645_11705, partial [Myxococcota bacterium]